MPRCVCICLENKSHANWKIKMWEYLSTALPVCCSQCEYNWIKNFYWELLLSFLHFFLLQYYSLAKRQNETVLLVMTPHSHSVVLLVNWCSSFRCPGQQQKFSWSHFGSCRNELCCPASVAKSHHTIRAFPKAQWSDSLTSGSGANYPNSQLSDLSCCT